MSEISKDPHLNKSAGRLIPKINLPGQHQMAFDVLLLRDSVAQKKFDFIFRFYQWEGAWLSIGKNQKEIPLKWKKLAKERKISITRRPSGGKAVLHNTGGLTYSLIWLNPPRKKQLAYFQACQWLIEGFKSLGLSLTFGDRKLKPLNSNCFATSSPADLIDSEGFKRIGSAQYWHHGHLLQHGEILLDPPKELWLEVFETPPPKSITNIISKQGLDKYLTSSLKNYWNKTHWETQNMTSFELKQISNTADDYLIDFESAKSSTILEDNIASTI